MSHNDHDDQEEEADTLLDDLPESVSVCGSREGSSVSGRRRRRGKSRRKLREAVISDETEVEETGTEDTETGQREGDEVTSHIQVRIVFIAMRDVESWIGCRVCVRDMATTGLTVGLVTPSTPC